MKLNVSRKSNKSLVVFMEEGEGNGTPLWYSCLENPMDGGAWKEMATHSSVLAWRIPGMGDPGGLPSMGSHRVAHD